MKIKTVIFDFDGTLADTLSLAFDCVKKLSDEFGYKINYEDLHKLRGKSAREIIKQTLGLKFYHLPLYVAKIRKLMKNNIADVKLFDGIKEVLEDITAHYRFGVITSNSREIVEQVVRKSSINVLDFIFSGTSIFGKDKVIKNLLKKYDLKKDEIVYVGDEIRDIVACRKIGVKIIAVSWGFNLKDSLAKENPDYLIEEPKELVKVLSKL